jgi:hypothetical protein
VAVIGRGRGRWKKDGIGEEFLAHPLGALQRPGETTATVWACRKEGKASRVPV